jgi:hypothetical protein
MVISHGKVEFAEKFLLGHYSYWLVEIRSFHGLV